MLIDYKDLLERIKLLEAHKARQIDENRKLSKRVDELSKCLQDVTYTAKTVDMILCEKVDHLYDRFDPVEELAARIEESGDYSEKEQEPACPTCGGHHG